ncbi:hypothetical protein CYME_CMK072C [Cyanidioschyzon merolae strain 10D]|jgi:hypothetical protein|uniref:EGF-like domain-containing protein n=1 Tax=Cyanidioschyzon merolae (strain NIES-3377 / 10D) TaxID=280699 RepID=M1V5D2_CYAM1|nr:hypothetical protein CYME_CMK072C [Cyanidioschyzon merolae strain 10D]BAM80465.1 hypothetical protein CYME_CMK072C [Cyanidioschyzon merolae strain 10D]|eukprot:XP_005536501.1 hypothetical protein CYME_CMK072C [Cyanidioschyzon merolae strain 10D]
MRAATAFLALLCIQVFYYWVPRWQTGSELVSLSSYGTIYQRPSAAADCYQGTVNNSAGGSTCTCNSGWYTVPENAPVQCACNLNCDLEGTKSCNRSLQVCFCKDGYGTAPNQNPKNRVYCNVKYPSTNSSSNGGGATSPANSTGGGGFNLSGISLPTILLALVCLGIGAAIFAFCCCLCWPFVARARMY